MRLTRWNWVLLVSVALLFALDLGWQRGTEQFSSKAQRLFHGLDGARIESLHIERLNADGAPEASCTLQFAAESGWRVQEREGFAALAESIETWIGALRRLETRGFVARAEQAADRVAREGFGLGAGAVRFELRGPGGQLLLRALQGSPEAQEARGDSFLMPLDGSVLGAASSGIHAADGLARLSAEPRFWLDSRLVPLQTFELRELALQVGGQDLWRARRVAEGRWEPRREAALLLDELAGELTRLRFVELEGRGEQALARLGAPQRVLEIVPLDGSAPLRLYVAQQPDGSLLARVESWSAPWVVRLSGASWARIASLLDSLEQAR